MKHSFPDNEQGFSLLEILIAVVIFSFSVLTFYFSVGVSQRSSLEAEKTFQANLLGQQQLTQIRLDLEAEIERGVFPDEKEVQGNFEKPFEKFKWSYTVKKVEIPLLQPPEESGVTVGPPATPAAGSDGIPQPPVPGLQGAATGLTQMISKKIGESVREIQLKISWGEEEENLDSLTLVTHIVKLK